MHQKIANLEKKMVHREPSNGAGLQVVVPNYLFLLLLLLKKVVHNLYKQCDLKSFLVFWWEGDYYGD